MFKTLTLIFFLKHKLLTNIVNYTLYIQIYQIIDEEEKKYIK